LATRLSTGILILLVLSILFIPVRSVSVVNDEWLPVDPAELKMTSDPLAPGAPAIYLFRRVDRDDSGRETSESNYVRIKILTEEGRKYANVEIPFEKDRYKIIAIRARTIRPDGSIVNFDGKTFENTIVKSKSLKFLAKTFSMPEASVGSIIEYKYILDFQDNYIFNSNWILSEELFTRRAQFTLKPFSQGTWQVQWTWPAGLPKGTEPPKEGPDHIIRMDSNNIPAFQIEDFMPPQNELKYRVNFLYHDSTPELNVDKFWTSFGKKQNDRVETFVGKRKVMEQAVAQIVGPSDSQLVKLQKIYARTQQVRNLSYENSKTEQEEKRDKLKSVSNVEELWNSGYGSGWNITWLFLGLARAAGFEAYPCLVSGRSEYFFRKERLNSAELDANVVMVKLDGNEVYFDPGAQFTPFGMLPWAETGVLGLKLDKNGGSWIQTNLPDSAASRVERKAVLNLTDQGSLEGTVTVTYTGLEALSRRAEQRHEDETSRKKFLEDELREAVPAAIDVELTNKPAWSSSDSSLVAEFTLKVPGWASAAGHKALLPVGLFGAPEKHLFEHADRTYAVYFEYPSKKIDDLKIELPLGWKTVSVPKPTVQDAKAIEYKISVEDGGVTLHIQREFRCEVVMIPKAAYPALRSFYQLVRTQDEQQIVLQPGGASASR
jgi:hypothetical protein